MRYLFLLTFLGLIFTMTMQAMAVETQCAPADVVHEWHAKNANQTPDVVGIVNDTLLLEILSSPEGETWAIILTGADGNSCLMLSGTQMTRLNAE